MPLRKDSVQLSFHVPLSARSAFRKLALDLELTGQDLLARAVNDCFVKHGLARLIPEEKPARGAAAHRRRGKGHA